MSHVESGFYPGRIHPCGKRHPVIDVNNNKLKAVHSIHLNTVLVMTGHKL